MAKKMLIDATHAEETRVVVVDGHKVEDFDFESQNKRQLAGNIYLAKVTRVEPSLQAAFVDYGGNRHGFLAFGEIHPDYYQIPVADREALLAEEREYAEALKAQEEAAEAKKKSRRAKPAKVAADAETSAEPEGDVAGMETIDLSDAPEEGASPMELVPETPVETPAADEDTEGDDADADDAADGDTDVAEDAPEAPEELDSAEDDVEEVRLPRKPRPRRYKIQEVIKVRQILLVQVVKEERGNKGAALTTYLSLAGRYCVLMPNTARGGGISRKITNAADRKKLKDIANSIEVPDGAGLIVRTAGAKRTKTEIKRDYEYLQRLWEQIRELTLASTAPAKIYEEGDLIKRSIRDLYGKEIEEVLVEGEAGYRNAKDFMKMIMPSHAKNVKLYHEGLPLFARFQVENYLDGMFNPTVQLKSGGYIVINPTEALVSVDVNSGRATKEGSIEETALKTNLEAAEEVARQMRLRDLAGLIVIDFIDMDERRNNTAVEKRLKDSLKNDRARIQVGRISGFGLLEMSRQRLRPGMLEATTQPCPHCHGTGLLRSDDSMGLSIIRALEEEGVRRRSREVLVKCPVPVANFLINEKREHIAAIEARYGMSVRIEADVTLTTPDYSLEKFKTATRVVREAPVITGTSALMDDIDEEDIVEAPEEEEAEDETPSDDDQPKKKRRRRRGGRNRGGRSEGDETSETSDEADENGSDEAPETPEAGGDEQPKKRRRRSRGGRGRGRKKTEDQPTTDDVTAGETETEEPASQPEAAEADPIVAEAIAPEPTEAPTPEDTAPEEDAAEEDAPKPKRTRTRRTTKKKAEEKPAPETVTDAEPEPPVVAVSEAAAGEVAAPEILAVATPDPAPEATPEVEPQPEVAPEAPAAEAEEAPKPKRRGWWSMGR
ncbi:MAG: Rne/Rng family ribonuclease [Shimia sp.]